MTSRRSILRILTSPVILTISHALAAAWPGQRPIRLIIPTPPGGGVDILARTVGAYLGRALDQTVIVENITGANGVRANNELARSAADGYTALFTYTSAVVVNMVSQQKLPYDTLKDLKPVAQVGAAGTFLAVASDVPVDDLESFIRWVRASPDTISYGSWGVGSLGHLTMEALKMQAGIHIAHVPYRGTAPVLADLVSGVLKVAFVDTVAVLPYIKQGRIRVLAINGKNRAPLTPDVRTMAEQGYPFELESWFGVFMPGRTPDAIIKRMNAEINRILFAPEMKERFTQLNMFVGRPQTAEEFGQIIQEDIKSWGHVLRANNIKLE